MMMKKKLLAFLPISSIAFGAWAEPPRAVLGTGTVTGVADKRVERFLGIPYAKPPVGPLRWRAPQPASTWRGVRHATAYGNDCMQEPFPSDAAPLGTRPAEDCLTINVWRPAGTKPGARLPVLFWIYGGGNVNGGASPAVYSGDAFARDGVIMVSFNWRVGRFGFFAFPELTRQDADHGPLGNYGYMDTIAALKWVRRNVAAFGGDPAKVTIYGQSAGAGQVAMLLTTPLARGLFSRAIIQSGGGTGNEPVPFGGGGDRLPAEQTGINFARRWGIAGTDAVALRQLRALTAEQVTDGIHIGTSAAQRDRFAGPVMEGGILTGSLVKAALAAREAKVPLIIGSTTADNSNGVRGNNPDEAFATMFPDNTAQARAAYLADRSLAPDHVLREIGRDLSYGEPARTLATAMTAQGLPVYTYRFGYVATAMRGEWPEGPPHATDIPYAMETVRAKYGDALTPLDARVSHTLHGYWVNFVKSGNPNGPGLPAWPAYERRGDVILSIDPDGTARATSDPHKARLDAVAAMRGR